MKKMVAWGMRAKVFGLLWITYFFALTIAFLPIFAHADVLAVQPDDSSVYPSQGSCCTDYFNSPYFGDILGSVSEIAAVSPTGWSDTYFTQLSFELYDLRDPTVPPGNNVEVQIFTSSSDTCYGGGAGPYYIDVPTNPANGHKNLYQLNIASSTQGIPDGIPLSGVKCITADVSGTNNNGAWVGSAPFGSYGSSDGENVYYDFEGDGTQAPLPADAASSTDSEITGLSPADGSTTASTTVPVVIGYFDDLTDGNGYDTVGYTIYSIDQGYTLVAASSTPLIGGIDWYFTSSVVLPEGGAYQLQAYLKNSSTGALLFSGGGIPGADNTGQARFSVVTNPFPGLIGASSTNPADLNGLATSTCNIVSLVGCVQNALVWAFYPSSDLLNQIAGAGFALKNEVPFGYLFVNLDEIQQVNASGTPAFVLATSSPLILYIFGPLDVGLAGVLGLGFLVWLFLRVRKIEL